MATVVLLLPVLIFSCKNIKIQSSPLSLFTCLNLSRFADFSSCMKINQPPVAISREGNPTVTLQCEQDHQYYHMYWYRRGTSRRMQRLAFSYGKGSSSTEAPFNTTKFIMSRPALLLSSLQIKSVRLADSAVYYCASSVAQWFRKPPQFDNNLRSNLKVVLTSLMFQHQLILPQALTLSKESPQCGFSVLKSIFFFNLMISKHIKCQKSSYADLYWCEAELHVYRRYSEDGP